MIKRMDIVFSFTDYFHLSALEGGGIKSRKYDKRCFIIDLNLV